MSVPSDPVLLIALGLGLGVLFSLLIMVLWLPGRSARARAEGRAERDAEVAGLGHDLNALEQRYAELHERHAMAERELADLRPEAARLGAERAALADRSGSLAEERDRLRDEARDLRARLLTQGETNAGLQAQLREQARAADEKLALLGEAETRLREAFQNLAQRILDERAQRFGEQSRVQIGGLIDPLREQLKAFADTVKQTHDAGQRERVVLGEQIEALKRLNQQISEDAINLTRALKGESQTQGAWGELVLERVLEASGLQAGREYELQTAFKDEDGGRPRPDVVVRLPENRALVIDSKVSLVAYERLVSASDEAGQGAALRELLVSLRRHIDGLSARRYESLPGLESLDFVLMFIPVEAAFIEAVRADAQLYQYALQRNISLVSPSTLLATLRTVAYLWKLERQNQNAQEIARRGALLHDNFVLLVDELQAIGSHLDKAQGAHASAVRRLTDGGKGSVLLQVRSLAEMGVPAKKRLPDGLVAQASAGDEESAGEDA